MKTIGLIGGMSWVSTVDYYRNINQSVNKRLGGLRAAKILLYSVNFEEFKNLADSGNWTTMGEKFIRIAQGHEKAGADCILFCANTPHMVADTVQKNISIPLIHIAEETAKEIKKQNINKVGLLGTRFTMEQSFFKERLLKYGIETVIPAQAEREFIHASIFNELGKEIFKAETKKTYLDIIGKLQQDGAKGIIFGCTEIPLLIKQEDCNIPAFDTTLIHTASAVEFALGNFLN